MTADKHLLVTTSVLAVTALLSFAPTSAFAAKITSISIDKVTTPFDAAPTIHMKDGGSGYVFDKIEAANLKAHIKAKASVGGYFSTATVTSDAGLLWTLPQGYQPNKIDQVITRYVAHQDLQPYHALAAQRCNAFAQVGKKTTSTFQFAMRFTATANSKTSRSDVTSFTGNIVCGPKTGPKGPGGLAQEPGSFKVRGISLAMFTTSHGITRPNPGTMCKIGYARVSIETSKPGPVRFRMHSKIGNGTTSASVFDAWSKHDGKGKFQAVVTKSFKVDKTAPVQVMVEELVNSIGLTAGWKSLTLKCTGAGGGGLASAPSAAPDKPSAPKPPKQSVGGGAKDLTGKPSPTHGRKPANLRLKIKTAPAARQAAVGGKTTFDKRKPHVN